MKRSYFGASGGYLAPLGPRFAAERWPNRSPAEPDTPKKMWGYPMRARRPICVFMHSSHHHHQMETEIEKMYSMKEQEQHLLLV